MNKTLTIIGGIALLTIGIFIGKMIDWPFFSIEKDINIIDVFSIIITSYLAYYVVRVLEKKGTEDRHEKDLILKRIDDLEAIIQQCSVDMSDGEIPYIDASAFFSKATLLVNRIFTMITVASVNCDLSFQVNLIDLIRSARNLSTNTPRSIATNSNTIPDLVVNNGIIQMSPNRLYEVEEEFEKLRTLIFEFQVSVNRA